MPELGSKISLISKADIRYEGRLFTVDPQECTIALASVRSFGTENRETEYPVPAQSQVYDYILFRGSDIKDIRIINSVTQPLNDPAIMQLSVPPSLSQQSYQANHPVLGPMNPQMNQFAPGYGMGPMGGIASGLAPGMGMAREPPRSMSKTSVLDLIGGGTRSTTPTSLGSRKSPTADQGTQAGGKHEKKLVKPIQPPGQRNHQRRDSRERRDSRSENQNYQNQNRSMGNRSQNSQSSYHQPQTSQGGQQRPQQGWTNRGPVRPRGRPRGSGVFKPNQQGNKKNTLKFDSDYDFEQANTEFEELRSQFAAKVKIEEQAVKPPVAAAEVVNGDVDKKDDSGNETGAGENEVEEEHEVYYDKTKSFFDKISCEAVERAKGKSQRTDWRTERKLNSETFGVAATRRGNYRGRGGYRGGMGYRGGYRGGYRQPQMRRDQQGNQRSGHNFGQNQQSAQNNSNSNNVPVLQKPELVAQAK